MTNLLSLLFINLMSGFVETCALRTLWNPYNVIAQLELEARKWTSWIVPRCFLLWVVYSYQQLALFTVKISNLQPSSYTCTVYIYMLIEIFKLHSSVVLFFSKFGHIMWKAHFLGTSCKISLWGLTSQSCHVESIEN